MAIWNLAEQIAYLSELQVMSKQQLSTPRELVEMIKPRTIPPHFAGNDSIAHYRLGDARPILNDLEQSLEHADLNRIGASKHTD